MNSKLSSSTFATASITREAALALSAAARTAADQMGIKVAIAVTDGAGHLVSFERSDGVPFLTIDAAIDKAWSAVSFGLGTNVWNEIVKDPKVAQLTHRPRLLTVGGGLPIIQDGKVVGGIGISGASADQDHEAGKKALSELGFDVPE